MSEFQVSWPDREQKASGIYSAPSCDPSQMLEFINVFLAILTHWNTAFTCIGVDDDTFELLLSIPLRVKARNTSAAMWVQPERFCILKWSQRITHLFEEFPLTKTHAGKHQEIHASPSTFNFSHIVRYPNTYLHHFGVVLVQTE